MKNKSIVFFVFLAVFLFSVSSLVFAVDLTLWDWHAPRMKLTEKYILQYEKLNPDVKIETQTMGWDDYWKKLMAGLAARRVPDIAQFHNSKTTVFLNQLEPYPQDKFSLDYLKKNVINFESGYLFSDNLYFYPVGAMSSLIFYNQNIWQEAGLTDQDIPKTWEQLARVAKKLTQYHDNGEVKVAGLALNGALGLLWTDLNYQKGGYLYNEEGNATAWNTEAGLAALNFLRQLVFEDKVTEPGFLNYTEAMGTESAAMVYSWSWMRGFLDDNYPDLNYGVFPLPTFEGKMAPGPIARNNHETGFTVLKPAPAANKKAAWEFLDWLYHDTDYLIESCLSLALAPADKNLWIDPRIQSDKIINTLVKAIPYTVLPGEFPAALEITGGLKTIEELTFNGFSVDDTLQRAEQEASSVLQNRPLKWYVEREYQGPSK